MKRVAIIGFGREGKALLKYLRAQSPLPDITILDRKSDSNYLNNLERFDLVYRSPGVPYNLPEIQKAIRNGVSFSSGTELFFRKAKGKVIGVTGTKGKGTTSTLIYKLLKNAGYNAYLAGNIGKPAITILNRLKNSSMTVLELSSFQLQDLKYSPDIAVVLGVFPDHMDAHKNFKEYFDAKSHITKFQKRSGKVIYVSTNKYATRIAKLSPGKKIAVEAASYKGEIKIRGQHNLTNAAVAAKVACELYVPQRVIDRTIKNYSGLHFRLQLVGKINNIRIYNDSASTNPLTTVAAIQAFKEPTILIMGGRDKNLDFKPLKKALSKSSVKSVVVYGESRNKIIKAVKGAKKIEVIKGNLEEAVRAALSKSRSGDSIIFSPGATSFDMFNNYEERGEKFDIIVKKLARYYTSGSKKLQP